ncbi:aldehyde dehydrogenase family protein [Thermosediminibacter litoriperuensis]|uniref:Propionaldehyde dehydrogenase n=1 Tax=Thermosediminibacter litoriperuensis TaxID=291989 RepID=A0A5S5ATP3_9FIRM|nr:aldehyde dehydrogenase family protein [Thermosediminibacter litoriperuensis]TYP55478.1 propionaldehyde dehydrogenase [Thermosediminibacter litoriperuensis]
MVDEKVVAAIAKRIINELKLCESGFSKGESKEEFGIFDNLDDAVEAASKAQKRFAALDLEKREEIIQAIREACMNNARYLAELTVSETGIGRVEDKIVKNILAAKKTPGTEDLRPTCWTGDHGLTLVEMAPVGVIGSITPVTNPVATVINNSISMLAAGNAVVFNPHPTAKRSSNKAVEIINEAIMKAGGPRHLVNTVAEPTIETAKALMAHPKVNLISVTGGKAVVNEALRSGKKAIGAGAGNPPVVVDETADIIKAAHDIFCGASFDNNLPCIAEKELIAVETIADMLLERLAREGAYILRGRDVEKITDVIFDENHRINKKLVGKDASFILEQIGIEVGKDVRLVVVPVDPEHPLVHHEQLMPVLPFVRVPNIQEAIELAVRAEGGNRHTAIMHSKNIDNMTNFARAVQTTIFVKNAPSYAGIGFGGEGYATFTIAGPTGEGLTSARTFTRQRRCVLVDAFRII